jgi:rhamnogalacturonan endolyase
LKPAKQNRYQLCAHGVFTYPQSGSTRPVVVALKFKATAKLFLLNSPCPSARRRVTIAVAAQPVLMKSFHIRPRILFLFPLAAMLGAAHLPAQSSVSLAPLPAVPGVPIPPMPSADELPTVVAPAATQPVTLIEDAQSYTLSNGIVTAQISKVAGTAGRSAGDLISLKYHGLEMLGFNSGHQAGYWETELRDATATVTIDPAKNDGARAEVSLKGAVGAFMQEERYALGRGESGVYTYAIYSHGAGQPAAAMGENRFGAKLNPALFDWLSVDGDRNLLMATSADWDAGTQMGSMKEARYLNTGIHKGQVEHKYDYCGYQFFTPAFGWSSTTRHVGIWFINPTVEFLGGGVTKDELDCHLDDNPGGDPLILDYWRGTHYGGCFCIVTAGEVWNKVVGPIFLYCNAVAKPAPAMADNANALFLDALAQAAKENTAWPYDWVNGVDYPHASERATVSGQLVLQDPYATSIMLPNLFVGLAYPDVATDDSNQDWQKDAKHYEFWVRGDAFGKFTIPKIRPGTYELHAIADGVLGEYAKANITVKPGQTLDLGRLEWKPVRYGKQLWDIGIPNRFASEFVAGNNFWHWGWYVQYATLFPHDINYTIGVSNYKRDWFIEQVPHLESLAGANSDTPGRATTWTVNFQLDNPLTGWAVLRLAICGAGNTIGKRGLIVAVNGQPVGAVYNLRYINSVTRDAIGGYWTERDVTFNAAAMKVGLNQLTLTVPAGSISDGVMYDYIRLELADRPPPGL